MTFVDAGFAALIRADIARLYSLCAVSGMRFHLLALPQDIEEEPLSLQDMVPKKTRQLFEAGYHLGAGGPTWRLTPPGYEPGEEAVPRDQTQHVSCR